MIVDLERNDVGRICKAGSVHVPHLASLRSYPALHHLVAEVRGMLRDDVLPSDLLRATFPGGSITGAPKIRAMQILRDIEPVARDFYTGSLFWFGDDGTLDSSILIRTAILTEGKAFVGAGGGVVADSVPEGEWREANDKARALLRVFGASPEEAE
jgi:para-aminobenzoate synthetase component 1